MVPVGVGVGRTAVGGPARVTDAEGARRRALLELVFEALELALTANHPTLTGVPHRDAGRVVAAILEAAESRQ